MLRYIKPLALCLLLAAAAAQAQSVYRWVDDKGETHYGQSVPPEYKDYGYVRLGPNGTVRERVEPKLTPEQIAERRRQRAEQARRDAAAHKQQVQDRMLLVTYNNEQEIHDAFEAQRAGIESQRVSTRMALDLVETRFEKLISRAAQRNRAGQIVPAQLQEQIDETRGELRALRGDLARLDEREAQARERTASRLKRYRQLTGSNPENDS